MSKSENYKEKFKKFLEFLNMEEKEINKVMAASDSELKRIAELYSGYIFTGKRWRENFKKNFKH